MRRGNFDLKVLNAIIAIQERGNEVTIRGIGTEIGPGGYPRSVWLAVARMENAGILRWDRRKRKGGKIEILLHRVPVVRIPIVGVLGSDTDFVPGTRWVELKEDGTILIAREDGIIWRGIACRATDRTLG